MNSLAFAVLAASEKPLDPNNVKPGWVALGIVALMCLATFFLIRSFIRHTRKASEPWKGESTGTNKP